MGWFRPVHAKTLLAQEVRALLTARKQMWAKLMDTEGVIKGILRGFGLKIGAVTRVVFEQRVRDLVAGQLALTRVMEPMLRARDALCRVLEPAPRASCASFALTAPAGA